MDPISELGALILVFCVLAVVVAIYVFVPWAARLAALSLLHGYREQLYALGTPEVRKTLLYRDVEFLLCVSLHAVRDGKPKIIQQMFSGALRPKETAGVELWRARAYERDARQFGVRLDKFLGLLIPAIVVLMGYLLLQKPQRLLVALIVVMFTLVRMVTESMPGPFSLIATAVQGAPGDSPSHTPVAA